MLTFKITYLDVKRKPTFLKISETAKIEAVDAAFKLLGDVDSVELISYQPK